PGPLPPRDRRRWLADRFWRRAADEALAADARGTQRAAGAGLKLDFSSAAEGLEELGAGGGEVVGGLHSLGGGAGVGDLRVAQLDGVADAGGVAALGEAQAGARVDERLLGGGDGRLGGAHGQARLLHLDVDLLPQRVALRLEDDQVCARLLDLRPGEQPLE